MGELSGLGKDHPAAKPNMTGWKVTPFLIGEIHLHSCWYFQASHVSQIASWNTIFCSNFFGPPDLSETSERWI